MKFRSVWFGYCSLVMLLLCAPVAHASFHLLEIDQVYSDASGNVQYIRFTALAGGQQFVQGQTLKTSLGAASKVFTFPTNLPGDTTGKKFLVATQGFADLNIVTPDYVVPNGFLFTPNGTINFASSVDTLIYERLPTTGSHAIDRTGTIVVAQPQNFAGATGTVNVPPPLQKGPMDVDQNGKVDPLTDGLLMLRYFFGLRGNALIANAVGQGAARNTAMLIEAYLATCVAATGSAC